MLKRPLLTASLFLTACGGAHHDSHGEAGHGCKHGHKEGMHNDAPCPHHGGHHGPHSQPAGSQPAGSQPAGSQPAEAHGHGGHGPNAVGALGHRFDDPAQWAKRFDDPTRDTWQKPAEVVAWLGLAPNALVADVGAGTGYFSVHLARALPQGTVFAADLELGMVAWLADRAAREHLFNVRPIIAKPTSPALPDPVDVIFICNTWHHIADRPAWLKAATEQLRPGGRIVIVDYTQEAPDGPPKAMRLTAETVINELEAAGFRLQKRDDKTLPRQYMLDFQKAG